MRIVGSGPTAPQEPVTKSGLEPLNISKLGPTAIFGFGPETKDGSRPTAVVWCENFTGAKKIIESSY